MFGSDILEVAIGLIFVYFILSLLAAAFTEWIARFFALRSKTLQDGIWKLLNNDDRFINEKFLEHPLIKGIFPKEGRINRFLRGIPLIKNAFPEKPFPSNLSARTVSLVIFDTLANAGTKEKGTPDSLFAAARETVETLEKNIVSELEGDTRKTIQAIFTSAKNRTTRWGDVTKEFRSSIEKWF